MELSYGQLETTLITHLRIHPDRVGTFRSRIKQLQRLQFPPGVNVGRGARMAYSGEHLFQLVTAFELIAFGLPAMSACTLVERHWEQFSAGYALSALQGRRWPRKEKDPHIVAVLWIEALHEIQFNKHAGVIEPSSVAIKDQAAAVGELADYDFDRHNTRLIISIGKALTQVLEVSRRVAGVEDASVYDAEFHRWLPPGEVPWISFRSRYPDRSNLPMRQHLHRFSGEDPDSLTPDGMEEAQQFLANDYDSAGPF